MTGESRRERPMRSRRVGPLREAAGEYVVVRDVTVGDPDR